MVMVLLQIIVVVMCVLAITNAAPVENVLPSEITNCVIRLTPLFNTTDPRKVPGLGTQEDVYLYCLQQFVWRADMVRWEEYNITKKDKDFVNGLLDSLMKPAEVSSSRSKRQIPPNIPPPSPFPQTGFRIRREYRRLSDAQRNAFHTVLQTMKQNGQYDTFANLHEGVSASAHGGPNFLGWHRVYLALLEEAMRNIDNTVSLPYWDSSLDNEMFNPASTILFSTEFFGNGFGHVTTGPFAYWATPIGPLTRNIAGTSSLFTKANITAVLTRCQTSEIVRPTAASPFNLETFHGGPHRWVGGQMSGITTSSHDPIFFLHHAFVDYIWEKFRFRQRYVCNPSVNPEIYPSASGLHGANEPMVGFPGYINRDGYRNYWTQTWYKYEDSPKCPSCGRSKYLKCNKVTKCCVPIERKLTSVEGCTQDGICEPTAADMTVSNMAAVARDEVESLEIGELFDAPPAEPRTQEAQMARMAAEGRGTK